MVLGTAELGMAYGINNTQGKPELVRSFEILDSAWNGGIRELDTAAAYGEAELIIGKYQSEKNVRFVVDTKLPVSIEADLCGISLDKALKNLGCDRIHVLYLHSFEQCKEKAMMKFLNSLKEEDKIDCIGISIYEPFELEYIMDNLQDVDVIQFPFNIFDNVRWRKEDLLKRAKYAGKTLYARSIYLQGLLFRDPADVLIQKMGADKYISYLHQICMQEKITIQQLAFQFVEQFDEIDEIIVGCGSSSEVSENVSLFQKKNKITSDIVMSIENIMNRIPSSIIDPRTWRNT